MNRSNGRRRAEAGAAPTPTFGGKILAALADFADAVERGDVAERLTCRTVRLDPRPEPYSPELVRTTRRGLGLSQPLFAKFLGISPKTVRSWEQGVNVPSTMACRFMDEIRRSPEHWAERLRQMALRDTSG
ncbi:MAG: hypothetical protein U0746_08475 [Gemmataceae bacterium]